MLDQYKKVEGYTMTKLQKGILKKKKWRRIDERGSRRPRRLFGGVIKSPPGVRKK